MKTYVVSAKFMRPLRFYEENEVQLGVNAESREALDTQLKNIFSEMKHVEILSVEEIDQVDLPETDKDDDTSNTPVLN